MMIKNVSKTIIIQKIVAIFFLIGGQILSQITVKADPDDINSGIEYNGTAQVKIGDYFQFKYFTAGGFAEIRNEKRFNNKILPNHNWRGYLCAYGHYYTTNKPEKSVGIMLGFEHESAHPTMGIKEQTSNPYNMIYDDSYRTMALNSVICRYSRVSVLNQSVIRFMADYQFYFLSKNTPELSGDELTTGNGICGGIEYVRTFTGKLSGYASLFDRYILGGKKTITGQIYVNDTSGVIVQTTMDYPIMNALNSLSMKVGVMYTFEKINRSIDIYYGMLYGNIFGFVDSRDERWKIAGGLSIGK
jgi:hypothetical protein